MVHRRRSQRGHAGRGTRSRALRSELHDGRKRSRPTDYQPLHTGLEPRFFGAGGPQMAAAGVDLAFDMTAHSVIGLSEALKHYFKFRRLFHQLVSARARAPARRDHLRGFLRLQPPLCPRHQAIHPRRARLVPRLGPQRSSNTSRRRSGPRAKAAPIGMARDYDLVPEHLPVREGVVCEARAAISRWSSSAIPSWTATGARVKKAQGPEPC